MKKTLSLLMGALLAAMLPVGNAMAQVKTVQVEVLTLDNAALASAVIYGDTVSGRTYFVDSALLAAGYTGDLVKVDTLPYIDTLTVSGNTASGSVDSTEFSRSMIVFRDVNGKTYVLGNVSNRMNGVFQASSLFIGTTTGLDLTGASAVGAAGSMLSELPMITYRNSFYSALKYATVNAIAGDTIRLNYNSPAGLLDTVFAPVVLNFAGDTVNGAIHLAHTTGTLTVMGGKLNMITGSADAAAVVMKAIDSLGSFTPGQHATTIESGNYALITPASGANILINGGCFGAEYSAYTANRFHFGPNPGANAASFPYTIVPGYAVTWHNWDFANNDTTIYYDQPDNKIRPVLASPFPATCDTVINGWFTDAAFTNSWEMLVDTLSQDTNIYVRWAAPAPGTVRVRFAHNLLDADNNVATSDTVIYYDVIGNSVSEPVRDIRNYFCNNQTDTVVTITFTGNDTVVAINYERDTFLLTWNLGGGAFTDGFAETQVLRWGAPIDFTHVPVLEGHIFNSWLPAFYTTMPAFDLTLNAQYNNRLYGLTWSGVGGTTPYIGAPITTVSATFTDDNGNIINADLRYIDPLGNTVNSISAVGSYSVIASSPNPNYHFNEDTIRTIVIVPATLTVTGTTAEMVKFYDNTRDAVVTNPGTLNTVYGSDNVTLTTTALFTDQYPGEGKTIVAHYTISGTDASSYKLDTAYAIVGDSNSATILAPITPNTAYGSDGGGYQNSYDPAYAGFRGYCTDTATITFKLAKINGVSAVVDEYTLFFNAAAKAEGFADVTAYTSTVNDTTIQFIIPDTAKAGDYTTKLVLRNSAYPTYTGDTITIKFTVGMNKDYVTAIFGDVLTIVNKGEVAEYDQYNWFCNGVEMGQYGQYYQDPNGLSSSNYYYVQLTNSTTGATVRTCPQSFVDVLTEDSVYLSTYPNPTTSKATVQVTNGKAIHTLRVMNVMGQVVFTTKFEGENYDLDLNGYANGTYTVTVDGATVRVIKK